MTRATLALAGHNIARTGDRNPDQRANLNWRIALYFGAVTGGALWGVLASVLLGTRSLERQPPCVSWLAAVLASSLTLLAGLVPARFTSSIRVRSAGIGLVTAALSGWLMLGWITVQMNW